MADEFVAARAKSLSEAGRVGVNIRIDQHRGRRLQFIKQIDHPPCADAIAIVAPGIVQGVGRPAARGEFGAGPFAESETFEIDSDIDGESGAVRPGIARSPADRRIIVALVGRRRPRHSEPIYARQPPKRVTSLAPLTASASTRKPLALVPSVKLTVPTPSGLGILATKVPNPAASSPQISALIPAPSPGATRSRPGLGGTAPGKA